MRGCATSNYNFCYIHIHGSEDYIIIIIIFGKAEDYIIHVITSFYRTGYIEPLKKLEQPLPLLQYFYKKTRVYGAYFSLDLL